MTTGKSPVQNVPDTSGKHGPLPFDINVAHQARMYDYLLGNSASGGSHG